MNRKGELIGLAFDGNWEAMSGDTVFEPRLQRTICVDIRYVLFIIDRFAGDTRLIDEMTIGPVTAVPDIIMSVKFADIIKIELILCKIGIL